MEWQAGYDSDGEDLRERNNFNIEEDVAAFEDEPSIRQNVYPDLDGKDATLLKARRRENFRRRNGNLYLGQVFISGIAFKEAVLDYVLKNGYNLNQYRYKKKKKLRFKCEGYNCSWLIYCSRPGNNTMWEVVVFESAHCYVLNGVCQMFKVSVIACLFVDKIREEPDCTSCL
ncbi:uncharacterized protein LOC112082020 [Eutrema salsugineum]|uniref:uncharacterized protein LOC112082020 n=1 Tax=Eutrema salsugineum TaxID=72664 RepID=UPI000CED34E4|nr:uncharacterized protein LOC112082020 [Eutrema salsugineum]